MRSLFSSLLLLVLSAPAFAFDETVPEPGSLALVGIAAAAGVYFAMRKKK